MIKSTEYHRFREQNFVGRYDNPCLHLPTIFPRRWRRLPTLPTFSKMKSADYQHVVNVGKCSYQNAYVCARERITYLLTLLPIVL